MLVNDTPASDCRRPAGSAEYATGHSGHHGREENMLMVFSRFLQKFWNGPHEWAHYCVHTRIKPGLKGLRALQPASPVPLCFAQKQAVTAIIGSTKKAVPEPPQGLLRLCRNQGPLSRGKHRLPRLIGVIRCKSVRGKTPQEAWSVPATGPWGRWWPEQVELRPWISSPEWARFYVAWVLERTRATRTLL